jgi:hypothetical protein
LTSHSIQRSEERFCWGGELAQRSCGGNQVERDTTLRWLDMSKLRGLLVRVARIDESWVCGPAYCVRQLSPPNTCFLLDANYVQVRNASQKQSHIFASLVESQRCFTIRCIMTSPSRQPNLRPILLWHTTCHGNDQKLHWTGSSKILRQT